MRSILGTLNLFGCSCVCVKVTWIRRADSSYRVKSPREDHMLRYDGVILDDVFVIKFTFVGYAEQVITT